MALPVLPLLSLHMSVLTRKSSLPVAHFGSILSFTVQIPTRNTICWAEVCAEAISSDAHVTDFLQSQCGLSESDISILKKRYPYLFRIKSTHRAQQAVELLRDYGFTESQVGRVVFDNPPVLNLSADESLRPRLELIKSLGISEDDLGDAVSRVPRMLSVKDLAGNFQYLEAVYGERKHLSRALRKDPFVLACDPERAEKQVRALKDSGLQEDIVFHMLSISPSVLRRSADAIQAKIQFLRDLGISESSKTFARAVAMINRYGLEKLRQKSKTLAELGMAEGDIREIFRKCPSVMVNSSDKLRKNFRYLAGTAGLKPSDLVKYPQVLNMSLETRIKPRHEVFLFLTENGPLSRLSSLLSFIILDEKRFIKHYVSNKSFGLEVLQICGRHTKTPV